MVATALLVPAVGIGDASQTSTKELSVCLTWGRPDKARCPTAKEIEAAVDEILGHPVFLGESCDIMVEGALQPSPLVGWEAKLDFKRRNGSGLGERALQSQDPNCTELLRPVSLVIALMVGAHEDQTTFRVAALNPPGPTVPTKPALSPADPAGAEVRSSQAPAGDGPEPRWLRRGFAYTDARTSWGILPGAGFGATLGFGATIGSHVPLRIDGTAWAPSTTEVDRYGGRFWAWHVGAAYCPPLFKRAELLGTLCTGAQAGALHGSGRGLEDSDTVVRSYGHFEARVVVSFPLIGPLVGSAHVGVAVPWVRPRFAYVDESGASVAIHRPQVLVLLGGLGFVLRPAPTEPAGASPPSPALQVEGKREPQAEIAGEAIPISVVEQAIP